MVYDIMSCSGFTGSFLACGIAWFSLAITVFIGLIARRQFEDGIFSGVPFNFIGAMVLGVLANLVVVTFWGDARMGLVAGLAGLAAGGIGMGYIVGGE